MNQENKNTPADIKARAVWALLLEDKKELTAEEVITIGAALIVCLGWLASQQPKEFARDILRAVRLMSDRRGRLP